jgi:hypothetical protein
VCAIVTQGTEDGNGTVLCGQGSKLGQGFAKGTFCVLDLIECHDWEMVLSPIDHGRCSSHTI